MKKGVKIIKFSIALFAYNFIFSAFMFADPPNIITYQGRLKENNLPVTGNRNIGIRVCKDEEGTNCSSLISQSVSVSTGLFVSTFTLPSDIDLTDGIAYLEISISGTALLPREKLTSVPYAIYSSSAVFANKLYALTGQFGVYSSTSIFIEGSIQASSGTFFASGAEQYSIETSSGIKINAGKLVTPLFQIITGASDGYLLRSDASGNATWVSPSIAGGDNLGNHTATQNFDMAGFEILNLSTINIQGENVVIGPYSPSGNYNYAISIGSGAYNNYDMGIGIGFSASGNYDYGVGIGAQSYGNNAHGIGIGDMSRNNYSSGIGIGSNAENNYNLGVGIGANTDNNYNYGTGIGAGASNNYNFGVGIGNNASGNSDYGVGIGAYSQNNSTYAVAVGAYSHAASSAVAIGSYAKATAEKSIAIGNEVINNSTYTVSFGDYSIWTSSDVHAAKYYGDGSELNNIIASQVSASNVLPGPLGSGVIASSVAINTINDTSLIQDGTIMDADLAPSGFDLGKFTVGTLSGDRIGAMIVSTHIVDGSIGNEDISDTANIAISKLATSGSLGSGVVASSIAVGAVYNEAISNSGIDAGKIIMGNLPPAVLPTGGLWSLSNDLIITTNNVVIKGMAGNIGIGTMEPSEKLEVSGNAKVSGSIQSNYIQTNNINIGGNSAIGYSEDILKIGESAGWNNLSFYTGLNENVRITTDGKIGIGTTQPLGGIDIAGRIVLSTDNSSVDGFYSHGSAGIEFKSGGSSYFRIAHGGGHIAIGSDSVWADSNSPLLQVAGSMSVGQNYLSKHPPSNTLIVESGIGIATETPTGLFQVGGGTLTVLANGNIGIGTTAPTHKLKVEGGLLVISSITAQGGFYGDGSGLTNVPGDNLGNHIATMTITANYGISASTIAVSSVTIPSDTGLVISTGGIDASGIFISKEGSIWTIGTGSGEVLPNARGMGAVDLQVYRSNSTQVASGDSATVSGGRANTASGHYSTVSGGGGNTASGMYSTVSGGGGNTASGYYSAVSGGYYNTAHGQYSWAGGYKSSSTANGTFTWADSVGVVVENNVPNRTWFKNAGGFLVTISTNPNDGGLFVATNTYVGIGTLTPESPLTVVGSKNSRGLSAINSYSGSQNSYAGYFISNYNSGTGDSYAVFAHGNDFGVVGYSTWTGVQGLSDTSGSKAVHAKQLSGGGYAIYAEGGKNYFDGNVGIGTTSPDAKLEVAGQVRITGGNPGTNKVLTSDASGLAEWKDVNSLDIQGDSLGNHIATMTITADYGILASTITVSTITMSSPLGIWITTGGVNSSGIFISTTGAIYTVGRGNGTSLPDPRGSGAIDLQNRRINVTQVASGGYSVISGGYSNTASGLYSTVGGGSQNKASGQTSTVSGGSNNNTTNTYSAVGGGTNNTASGLGSVIAGGQYNNAAGDGSVITGGINNISPGFYSSITGGYNNSALGLASSIIGGSSNTASGDYSFAGGFNSSSTANGSFTWSDSVGVAVENNVPNRTWFKNAGGFLVSGSTNAAEAGLFVSGSGNVGIGTTNPLERLEISTGNIKLADDGKIEWGLFPSPFIAGSDINDVLVLGTSGGEKIVINYAGVGIATNAPVGLFQVGGGTLTVLADGNVGVGTTIIKSKFQVNGDIGLGDGTETGNQPVTIWLRNNSGGNLALGTIVIVNGNNSFTTTPEISTTTVIGVVYEPSCSAGSVCRVAISGVVSVNIAPGGVAAGQHVVTSSTQGLATGTPNPPSGASIGIWLETSAGGQARALLR